MRLIQSMLTNSVSQLSFSQRPYELRFTSGKLRVERRRCSNDDSVQTTTGHRSSADLLVPSAAAGCRRSPERLESIASHDTASSKCVFLTPSSIRPRVFSAKQRQITTHVVDHVPDASAPAATLFLVDWRSVGVGRRPCSITECSQ